MSPRATRKEIEEYSADELASLLEARSEEVSESVEELNAVLRDVDGAPTDEQVTALWEAVDSLDAAAFRLACRVGSAEP